MTLLKKPAVVTDNSVASPSKNSEVVALRRPWQWVLAIVILILLAALAHSLWNNPNLGRAEIAHYFFSSVVLHGVLVTLEITGTCMLLGWTGGTLVAIMRLSHNPILSWGAWIYVQCFRAVPPIVQLLFWGFIGALFPRLVIGIPFTNIVFWTTKTNSLVSPFVAAVIGLSLMEIAYSSEVFRGGILGVDRGQSRAAFALGMTRAEALRRIILPQAMRMIIPPLGNNAIVLLKVTSLVSVIGGAELMTSVERIYGQNLEVIPLLIVAALWYLAMLIILSAGQRILERHFGHGVQQSV